MSDRKSTRNKKKRDENRPCRRISTLALGREAALAHWKSFSNISRDANRHTKCVAVSQATKIYKNI